MTSPPRHHAQVLSSPWPGVYGTVIESGLAFGKHSHLTHGLGLMEAGGQTSASGRGVVDARAGDLIATNPGEVHDGRPSGGGLRRWKMIYLEPHVLASMAPQKAAARDIEITQPVMQDAVLARTLRRLLARLEAWANVEQECKPSSSSTKLRVLACEEALVQTCALLLRAHTTAPAAGLSVNEARTTNASEPHEIIVLRERLADDLLNPPTLTELAALVGLSKFQVLRRFQKVHGLPPHAWLMWQRTERARGLMRSGMTLVNAAAASGFADQSHLHRCFVRHFGFTPGAWQRAHLT
jgi:AraC-like DNA-binding protein